MSHNCKLKHLEKRKSVSSEDNLIRTARRRVLARKIFYRHILASIFLNIMLLAVYFVTGFGGYFWPVWTILGSVTAIFIHWLIVLDFFSGSYQDSVNKEYDRLKQAANLGRAN